MLKGNSAKGGFESSRVPIKNNTTRPRHVAKAEELESLDFGMLEIPRDSNAEYQAVTDYLSVDGYDRNILRHMLQGMAPGTLEMLASNHNTIHGLVDAGITVDEITEMGDGNPPATETELVYRAGNRGVPNVTGTTIDYAAEDKSVGRNEYSEPKPSELGAHELFSAMRPVGYRARDDVKMGRQVEPASFIADNLGYEATPHTASERAVVETMAFGAVKGTTAMNAGILTTGAAGPDEVLREHRRDIREEHF